MPAPDAPLAPPATQWAVGLGALPRGIGFVCRHPGLWIWIALPLLINLAFCAALVAAGWTLVEPLIPDFAGDWGWFDWLRVSLGPALRVLLAIVAALAALLATLMLAGLVNAPFYDLLSEKVEALALGRPAVDRPWSELLPDALFALAAALSLLWRQAFVMAALYLLSFTAVGAPLFVAASFYYAGFSLVDVTLARKRHPAAARRAFARRHALLLLGLGLPVVLFPPLQPFGIAGATLLLIALPPGEASSR
ncbi:MAG TPA: EI24 domain-containing protein [Planctomycetota bacterium]|nr:EI24 domain-containing protein [Planctomycetota bacterium]